MDHVVKILRTELVTHDVKQFVLTKPEGFHYAPGHYVKMTINTPRWREQKHPFTPTSLNDDGVLEFTIKCYPDRRGLTWNLHQLKPGDELVLSDPHGDISYKGRGLFIAAGAGITPFAAIFRQLARDDRLEGNSLLFTNKRHEDIIYERELHHYLGNRCVFVLTRESRPGYVHDRINKEFLAARIGNFDQEFYVCGPKQFEKDVQRALKELGAESRQFVHD